MNKPFIIAFFRRLIVLEAAFLLVVFAFSLVPGSSLVLFPVYFGTAALIPICWLLVWHELEIKGYYGKKKHGGA